ncbi:MAG: ABC transporter permease [Endomicrobium sp.]|jgi:ABC-2 type transport system permease protein|nr:ABC transporter permease [Endomicrobium sp.]
MKIKALKNVLFREFGFIFRSKDMLLICFIAPLVYGLMFSYLYINKRATNINLGVVNQDGLSLSRKLIRNINATAELKTTTHYNSFQEGLVDIFKNNVNGFYVIPSSFDKNIKKGRISPVLDVINSSNFFVASNILKKFTVTAIDFSKQQFKKVLVDKRFPYKSTENIFSPIKINTVYLFNTQMNYSDFLLPCLLLVVLQQIILVAVCTSMSLEKNNNNNKLYKISFGNFFIIFLGKAIPYTLIGSLINVLNVYIILPIDGIYALSILGLFVMSTVFIMAIVCFAILVSVFFKSPEVAMSVLMFYSLPTALLSGFAWPHSALPNYLKVISYIFPSTCSMNYIRMFILGDVKIEYAKGHIIALIVFSFICFFITYLIEIKTRKVFALRK